MAQFAETEAETGFWPKGFIEDAATVVHLLDDISAVVPVFADQPLDPATQEWMREVLDRGRLDNANAAAARITQLHPETNGDWS